MNTSSAAASSAGAYAYICLYTHKMLCYTYAVYICYVRISVKSYINRTTKAASYTVRSVTLHKTSFVYIHFWKKELFPTTAAQQRQRVDSIGSRIFSGLISIFIFNILQIPCVSNHICTGCTAYTDYWPDCIHILEQAVNSADIWASVYPIKRLDLSHNCNHHIDVRQTSSLAAIEDCCGFTQ
jgi:hypothetical protein